MTNDINQRYYQLKQLRDILKSLKPVLQLDMYKLNKEWAEMLKEQGYTILDIGDFNNQGFSAFYAMEKSILFK